MTEFNQNIKPNERVHESLDFIFESVEFAILIENSNRQVEFVNTLFCQLFHIKLTPQQLQYSNIIDNARGFSMQFENAAAFEKSIRDIPAKQEIVRYEKWALRTGKTLLRDYIPIFKNNELKGHIWIYKEEKSTTKITQLFSKDKDSSASLIENALHFLPGEIAILIPNIKLFL